MHPRLLRSVAAMLVALVMGSAALVSAGSKTQSPETRLSGVVNVNTASGAELELLPGIGPSRAEAVIEYRKANGPFKNVSDLTQVSGIGEKALARIRQHCVLQGKTTAKLD